MVASEFQAVVFAAGKGSRLPEVLEERPKCLLPIGIFPLIWFPLKALQRHGFTDAIVLVLENEKLEIQQRLEKTQLKLKIEFCSITGDSDVGTADALRQIAERIKSDVILLSCDTIIEFSLFPVLKQFRELNASLISLLLHNDVQDLAIPGPKIKYRAEQDLFGICSSSNRLVFMGSESDFESNFKLSGHLLRMHESVDLFSGFIDAHVYVLKKWIIDYLVVTSNISVLKGELLPHILKQQLNTSVKSQLGHVNKLVPDNDSNIKIVDVFKFASYTAFNEKIYDSSIFDHEPPSVNDLIRCYAVITPNNTFGVRVNTLSALCSTNQKIYSVFSSIADLPVTALIAQNAEVSSKQISSTAIGDQTIIHEKTSIKSSTIGANCVINSKVLINNSILMDNVTVEENVVIENCIINDKSVIKSGSILQNCLIGSNYIVPQNSKKDHVHLSSSKDFLEI